jgi:hypothetical protein
MKAFLHTGCTIFQMFEISEAEMDALIERGDDFLPFRFDRRKRVWPRPPARAELFFYDTP